MISRLPIEYYEGNTIRVMARQSLVVQLITSKRSCTLVNCVVGGSSSCVDPTEFGRVDADAADGDAAVLDASSAMAEA